jgi:hypothetical protein
MKKKVISLAMAVVMLFSCGVPAFAAESEKSKNLVPTSSDVSMRFTNTDMARVFLDFTGNRANCAAIVDGKSGTSKITATVLLKRVEKNKVTTVKAWTGLSTTEESFYFDEAYYVSSGYTYELEITAKVYRKGTSETVSVNVTDYCA